MEKDITTKLNNELDKDVEGEPQIVFILTRIRKMMEMYKGLRTKYRYLYFFCNWSVHTEIDRINDVVSDVKRKIESGEPDKIFERFFQELREFINELHLSSKIIDNDHNIRLFQDILVDICSDTPLKIIDVTNILILRRGNTWWEKWRFDVDTQ